MSDVPAGFGSGSLADMVMSREQRLNQRYDALSAKQIKSIDMAKGHRVALWVGAVSGGKTIASLFAFLMAVPKAPSGPPIVIIGQTIQAIERNVIAPLQSEAVFGALARQVYHRKGSSTAVIMGRVVELIGASNSAAEGRIRGGTFGLVYVDEAVLLPEEFWKMLYTRLRTSGSRMLATTNPDSKNHWLRRDWILKRHERDMIVFHFTMHDNPAYFPGGDPGPEYIVLMQSAYAGVFYNRMILGHWTTAEGAIYAMWSAPKHVIAWQDMPPIRQIIGVGVDFGTANATSAIMLGITDERDRWNRPAPRLIMLDEWRHDPNHRDPITGAPTPRMAPSDQAQGIRAWLGERHIPEGTPGDHLHVIPGTVFVDPAAAHFAEQLGRSLIPTAGADNSHQGIGEVMSLLSGDRPRLLVTDRCTGWIAEVTEYLWDAKAQQEGKDEPVMVNDHSLDAGRYAVRSTRGFWVPQFQRAYGLAA